MVRRDVAMNRIGRASAWLNDADQWFRMDAALFRASIKERDLAISRVQSEALAGIPALRSFLTIVGQAAGL